MPVVTANVLVRHPKTGVVEVIEAGTEVPEWAVGRVASHVLSEADDDNSTGGYADRKVADLRAEIEQRNESREEVDLIPSDGNKADLVAALEADDDN